MGEVNGKLDGVNTSKERVHEWELGLPNVDDITPLYQGLLSSKLLSAFNITPEPYRTSGDVTQASEKTMLSLRGSNFNKIDVIADEFDDGDVDDLSESKKHRRNVSPEDADSAAKTTADKAAKPARLVWTPQLHKRFVDVVAHLGIKNSVPKTIMQLMNVEGLTRENVASHLQKYRLYLKRNEITPSISPARPPAAPAVAPESSGHAAVSVSRMNGPMPVIGNYNHQNYHQNYQQTNNNNYNYNQSNYNGVMQTGSNNMYGGGGGSYHHNHPNHNYHSHVAPGEK